MEIAIHLGAHCTDDDQLLKSLLKNSRELTNAGVCVPTPGRYRGLLAEALVKLQGASADQETQDMIIDALVDSDNAHRLVIGHKNFLGAPHRALEHNQLYHLAQRNSAWIKNLFTSQEVSFFLGMRNPATFVPAILTEMPSTEQNNIQAQLDPMALRWSNMIYAIRQANPGAPITVWCNEDTPLIWSELLQLITGTDGSLPLDGAYDILAPIMEAEGFARMQDYLTKSEIPSEAQRRRVVAAFLEKYVIDDAIEDEIDLPGWTGEFVDALSDAYDQDMDVIASLPGVTLVEA